MRYRQDSITRGISLALALMTATSTGRAQSDIQFTRLLDNSAIAPGSGGTTFISFRRVIIDGQHIAFRAYSNGTANFGHYMLFDGEVTLAADYNTSIPNGAGTFTQLRFDDAVLHGDELVFGGEGTSSQSGIYLFANDSLSVIFDETMNIPGATVPFTSLGKFGWDGSTLVMNGWRSASGGADAALTGLYRSVAGAPFEKVANGHDLYPGTKSVFNWLAFQNPIVESGATYFGGAADGLPLEGFLTADAKNDVAVLFNTTPDPWPLRGVRLIGGQSPVAVDAGRMLCAVEEHDVSGHTEGSALILRIGSAMHSVVDYTMPYPGVPGNFFWNVYDVNYGGATSETQASLAGDLLAFRVGWGNGGNGNNNPPALFVRRLSSGEFIRLVGVGDQFENHGIVTYVEISRQAIDGHRVVFNAGFEDGSHAIYLAEIPPPACPGDATGECAVNVNDLIAVILGWGPCGVPCPADINGTGAVDVSDLIAVILNWG